MKCHCLPYLEAFISKLTTYQKQTENLLTYPDRIEPGTFRYMSKTNRYVLSVYILSLCNTPGRRYQLSSLGQVVDPYDLFSVRAVARARVPRGSDTPAAFKSRPVLHRYL